jgi:hypothetical protein
MSAWASTVVACVVVMGGVACGGGDKSAAMSELAPDHVYKVRAQIVSVETVNGRTIANVAHEAIPNFKDRDGTVEPMPAMTMPFVLSPALDAAQLEPKSQWELTVEVRWSSSPGMQIAAAKPLPSGTTLQLERPHG